jgi:3-hydroxyisobutyrate dehydrogenase-like beta-hydroxyacid dehydrogenase
MRRIGILSIGEMGHACARLFLARGARVLTVLDGRSERTRALAKDAGVEVVGSVRDLIGGVDVVLSLVPPGSAMDVAEQVARGLEATPGATVFFVDANPISPSLARKIGNRIDSAGGRFVDGAVIGAASGVGRETTLVLSGSQACEIAPLASYGVKIRVLGGEVGQASALKVFNAGLNKGLAALLIELLLGASKLGILKEVAERYNEGFQGIVTRMDGFLAALPQHARRRGEEMAELEATLLESGIQPVMITATRALLDGMASLAMEPIGSRHDGSEELLRWLLDKKFLSRDRQAHEDGDS